MAKGVASVVENQAPAPVSTYKFEKQRQEESRLIKGIFQDNELKGGTLKFPFKKFQGDQIVTYNLTDGQEYDLPLSVVKHLNSNCFYSEDLYVTGLVTPDGKPIKNPNPKKKHRFSFKISEYT